METCIRGFSNTFIPESKIESKDLQFIEGDELERAWKTTRRMRLKKQEQKIWDEFVKEQDILSTVINDDPYQFLDQLPAPRLKEMMDVELEKMKTAIEENKEKSENIVQMVLHQDKPEAKMVVEEVVEKDTGSIQGDRQCEPTLVQLVQSESELFHIYDDGEGSDDEVAESVEPTPRTVRDRTPPPSAMPAPQQPSTGDTAYPLVTSSKSSENMETMIESSIYCAKVKELRIKTNDELAAIMTSLDNQDLVNLDRAEVRRLSKRSAEFCSRFHRIHVYQLHRQVHDLKRHNSQALPFAKHTQFQSQMVRIVSLHQNLLQAFQVFHKSFEQTACLRESCDELTSLIQLVRDAGSVCTKATLGHRAVKSMSLFDDELLVICDKVDEAVKEYKERVDNQIYSRKPRSTANSKKGSEKKISKKKSNASWMKTASKSKTDASTRLSMYSMDTLRHTAASITSSNNRRAKGDGGDVRGTMSHTSRRTRLNASPKLSPKSPKGWRKPLMRGPREPRPPRVAADSDICTMVENVDAPSSQVSREQSPENTPRKGKVRYISESARGRHAGGTVPGSGGNTSRTAPPRIISPRRKHTQQVYLHKPRAVSPRSGRTSPRLAHLAPPRSGHKSPVPAPASPSTAQQKTQSAHRTVARCDIMETINQDLLSPISHIKFVQKKAENKSKETITGQVNQKESGILRPQENVSMGTVRSPRDSFPVIDAKSKILPSLDQALASCEVTRLLRQLCGGDAAGDRSRTDRVSGAKNAQLLCINGTSSPRQPSTPQLLKILEETIQKKIPKSMYPNQKKKDINERIRLTFNISQKTADSMFQYRSKFMQFMLNSSMYANSAIGKPWEIIGSISEDIIDELLMGCVKEMELSHVIQELYRAETK